MKTIDVIRTPLTVTCYSDLVDQLSAVAHDGRKCVVDFTNTQIVVLRRHDSYFRSITTNVEHFIPDGMPLIWVMNARGAKLKDRIYGPAFMRQALKTSPARLRHFFLGGSDDCLTKLIENVRSVNPEILIVGTQNGYFSEVENSSIVDSIRASEADFVWVGLGTPKQQEWLHRNRNQFDRGVFLAVGFAFDVIAGTKRDAPAWMQPLGLTWLFRLLAEPKRLGPRYLKYNSLFCWYLLIDLIRWRKSK